jgi:hypothetical protein
MAKNLPIPTMSFAGKGDKTEQYQLWKQRLQIFSDVTGKKDKTLTPYLLQGLDDEGLKIYNSFSLSEDDKKDPSKILKEFEDRLQINKPNFRASRLELHFFYQKQDETLDDFYTRCKEKMEECEFTADEQKERFVEQVLASTPIQDFKKWLLGQEKEITLKDVLTEGRKHETTLKSLQHIKTYSGHDTSISAINKQHPSKQRKGPGDKPSPRGKCLRCGGDHERGINHCPAKESECHHCRTRGHWAKYCLRKQREREANSSTPNRGRGNRRGQSRGRGRGGKSVNEIHDYTEPSESDNYSEFDEVYYDEIKISGINNDDDRTEVFAKLEVQLPNKPKKTKSYLKLKVDTGAQGNTLPLRTFKQMMPEKLDDKGLPDTNKVKSSNSTTLKAYNGSTIPCYGITTLNCKTEEGDWTSCKFYIVDVTGPAICGLQMSQKMGLITMHCSMEEESCNTVEDLKRHFSDQFDRIGNLPGVATLHLMEDAVPFIDAPRKYSIHLKPKLKAELDKMESQQVIAKVTGHSDWCSSLATSIKRDGEIRVCIDPKRLNGSLKRCPHKLLTLEEINHRFHNAKYFSKLDAKAGYWSIKLDEPSQELTTFRTPFGRYKFLRLPFGLNVSQDIFQQKIDQILENCPGTVGIADDIAVFGATEEEHDRNLMTLMVEAKKNGLVFNSAKCEVKKQEIEYFGVVISANGMRPDRAKVADLKAMPSPQNKTELQEFLGLITYLGPFIRNLSASAEPIRKLLCKDTPFVWSADHEHVFEHLKTLISNEASLKFYDTQAPTYLMVDASQRGLGAALLQPDKQQDGTYSKEARPVVFASKSLSPAQKNYVNIEREMLAITFGIKRLHTYLYNRPFTVITDHKPLEVICNKPLTTAPARLQAMMLEIQGYQYRVKYHPGKDIGLADALSRLPNPNNDEDVPVDVRVEMVQFSKTLTDNIRDETTSDPTLNELKETIYHGFPEARNELPTQLRDFWSYREELSVHNGIIHKGERVYVPKALRPAILQNLHTGHLGITKTQLRAKRDVFWPKINTDIENMCKECAICQEHQAAQPHQPLLQTDIPQRPWSIVGTDLFTFQEDEYLIIVDYYTKFPLIDKVPRATSATIAQITAEHCSVMGIPDVIRSDNGPQFVGHAYSEFTNKWGIKHVTSSPRYPRSNGFVERQIRTIKSIMKKAVQAKEDVNLALLRWRTTPIDNIIQSPADLLFQRKIKDTLPGKCVNTIPNREEVNNQLQNRQMEQKAQHDTKARSLPPLYTGQEVTHRDPSTGKWKPAVVRNSANEPRSYVIQTPGGQSLRRNREHLRESPRNETPAQPIQRPGNSQHEKPAQAQQPVSASGKPTTGTPPVEPAPQHVTTTKSGRVVVPPARFRE